MASKIIKAGKDLIRDRVNVESFSTTECSEGGTTGPSGLKSEAERYQTTASVGTAGTRLVGDGKEGCLRFSQEFVDGLEARFMDRCKIGLGLGKQASDKARELFRETRPIFLADAGTMSTTSEEETERLWTAGVLYALKKLSLKSIIDGDKHDLAYSLSKVFDVTKLRVSDFCKELPHFLAKAGSTLAALYGDDYEKQLEVMEWRTNYFHVAILFDNYKRFYRDFFLLDASRSRDFPISSGTPFSDQMRFGWILFITFRIYALGRFPDLVTSINGLLAVFITLILHMPVPLREFSFQDKSRFVGRNLGGVNLLSSLCSAYNAEERDVGKLVTEMNVMIENVLNAQGSSSLTDIECFAGLNTEGLCYFDGLMEVKTVATNLQVLEKFYEETYSCQEEFDGRLFLEGDDDVVGAISVCISNASGSKWEADSQTSTEVGGALRSQNAESPNNSPAISLSKEVPIQIDNNIRSRTPIGITMSTAKWLRTFIGPLPLEPAEELKDFFTSCDHDVTQDVSYRLQVLLDAIFPKDTSKFVQSSNPSFQDHSWVKQRQSESVKIYYRVLTSICQAESQRLKSKNLTSLLSNERFQRCMVACAAELVLATHKTVTMAFPAVITRTGLTAFDLVKVTESFIKHEVTLPRELKRHLISIEERLLESLAWEKGSMMYNLLVVTRPHLAQKIHQLGMLAPPMPSLQVLASFQGSVTEVPVPSETSGLFMSDGLDLVVAKSKLVYKIDPSSVKLPTEGLSSICSTSSPGIHGQLPLHLSFPSPQLSNHLGGGKIYSEAVINIFLLKVLKLAAARIRNLCQFLHQDNYFIEQVYQVFQQALQDVPELFFNRHLDQIILCTIYGVCKVRKSHITFREIIGQYKKQSHSKPHVFRNVFIKLPREEGKPTGAETGDIIRFYNEVFVPLTKCILLRLSKNSATLAVSRQDTIAAKTQGSEVPRKALFPTIPEGSTKKASANHNRYVPAMPSAKAETLRSPCIGEITHAAESAPKDLVAVNNHQKKRSYDKSNCNGASMGNESTFTGSLSCMPSLCSQSSCDNPQSAHSTTNSVVTESQPSPPASGACAASQFKKPRCDQVL